jgi:iron complex transport system substrate-binding protein
MPRSLRFWGTSASLALGVLVSSSRTAGAIVDANIVRGCVDRFDPAIDYFPDKTTLEDAALFRVEYRRSYKVLTIHGGQLEDRPERHVLVQCGTPVPPLTGALAGAAVVTVPVDSVFAYSITQLPLLIDLGRLDVLTGVGQADAVVDAAVRRRIQAGLTVEFARIGLVIDTERVLAARPSLLMAGSSAVREVAAIRAAGIPVVPNAEWLEGSPLGRAEWIKFMALFLNEERRATSLHAAVKARYAAWARRVRTVPSVERPLVMTGRSSLGLFTIAGGRSYVARLIADAAGRYAWAGDGSPGVVTVDIEAQIARASAADVWINGGGWASLQAMLDDEPRYAAFKAFRDGRVWVYERRQTPSGANDYWSRSVTHPDLVLADLIKIFHPGLGRDHDFEWYMAVPGR